MNDEVLRSGQLMKTTRAAERAIAACRRLRRLAHVAPVERACPIDASAKDQTMPRLRIRTALPARIRRPLVAECPSCRGLGCGDCGGSGLG